MYKKLTIIFFLTIIANNYLLAQSADAFGIKGGTTIGFQNWNGQQRQALVEPLGNGELFYETPFDSTSSFIIETGYHKRGSAIWQRQTTYNDPTLGREITIPATTYKSVFECVNLQAAFRKSFPLSNGFVSYALIGIRLEYMFRDTIAFYAQLPIVGKNNFLYGVSVGGGIEKRIGRSPIVIQLEAQLQPDFAKQIEQPAYSYYDQYQRQVLTFPEQKVINVTGEITLGLKYCMFDE